MAMALLPKGSVISPSHANDRQWITLWEMLQDSSSTLATLEWPTTLSDPSIQKKILLIWIDPDVFGTPKHLLVQTPLERLQENITNFLLPFLESWKLSSSSSLPEEEEEEKGQDTQWPDKDSFPQWISTLLPQKWEHYSDFTLLPPTAFVTGPWPRILKRLERQDRAEARENKIMDRWEQLIQSSLQSTHIARKAIIPVQDILRRPKIRPLTGDWGLHNQYKTWIEEDHQFLEHLHVESTMTAAAVETPLQSDNSMDSHAHSESKDENNDTTPTPETFSQAYWAETCQNQVWYRWAPMFTMFSAGNITEKERIAKSRPIFDARGKTVVDLYAGVGYFSLVYLIHAGAKVVHACEWNPWSVEGLLKGATKNEIYWTVYEKQQPSHQPLEDKKDEEQVRQRSMMPWPIPGRKSNHYGKLMVYPGDNAQWIEYFEGQAHHVNLGLIPSAEPGWVLGVRALCPKEGGYLHVHHNVRVGEEETFKSCLLRTLEDLFRTWKPRAAHLPSCSLSMTSSEDHHQSDSNCTCHASWWIDIRHVENVKSFAPLVFHYVFDVECRPVTLVSSQPSMSV
ncbi:S-adenosyl-L-methionine-dependent methyltransferase [Mortierella sp. GBAus27b]|nr:S-adenosyl-L-methionine-dependent methyltransferase [Mortierella sp. GBAus27b]